MVAFNEVRGEEQFEELYQFKACCVQPINNEEPLTIRFSGLISPERMARIVTSLSILLDQKPGTVNIHDGEGSEMDSYKSTAKS